MSLKTAAALTITKTNVKDIKPVELPFKITSLVIEGYDFEEFVNSNFNIAEHIDWYKLSEKKIFEKLSDDFISKFKNKLNWYKICENNDLDYDFIRKYRKFINWDLVAEKIIKKDDGFGFLLEMKKYVKWEKLLVKFLIPEDFLYLLGLELSNEKEQFWKVISKEQSLSDNFVRDFYNQFDNNNCWDLILEFQDLGNEIVRTFKKKSKKFRKALIDYKKSGKQRYKIDEDIINNKSFIFQAPEKKSLQELLKIIKD